MIDEIAFKKFLKKQRRADTAAKRIVRYARLFEKYLAKERGGKSIEEAGASDLKKYAESGGDEARKCLWALRYAFEFVGNTKMRKLAGELREGKIERVPMSLGQFMGVKPQNVRKLEAVGIRSTSDMLEAGKTKKARRDLAKVTKLPVEVVEELVKLSDISRIKGISGKRARLFHDAGADSIEKLARSDPDELKVMLEKFVEKSGFDGIAPYAKEVRCTIESARELPIIVE